MNKISKILLLTACALLFSNSGWHAPETASGASLVNCAGCHGNPPADGTRAAGTTGVFLGSHNKHSGTAALQYAYACINCHYDNGVYPAGAIHSNGFINITGTKVKGNSYSLGKKKTVSYSPAFGTCTNVYCHSNGRTDAGKTQYSTSPTWGGGGLTCLSCHGGRTSAAGTYAASTGGFKLSTTHSQHLGKYPAANINCNMCHSLTATDAATLHNLSAVKRHVNSKKDATFSAVGYGSYTSYKSFDTGSLGNTKKCENVACHGGITRNPWSTTTINNDNTCVHCHGTVGTAAGLANTAANRKFFAPGYKGTGTSTDGNSSSNNIRVGSHFKHISSPYMKSRTCSECHRVPSSPFDGANTHIEKTRYGSQTLTFAQASTATIAIGVDGVTTPTILPAFSGYTAGLSNKAATCSSVYCHGNRMKNGDTTGTYRRPMWNFSSMINYTQPSVTCGRCHGIPPTVVPAAHAGVTLLTQCSGCHSAVINASGVIVNKALHVNGKVESKVECLGCHNSAKTGGIYNPRRVDTDFALASRHVFSRTVSSFDCVVCHLEADQTKSDTSNGANAAATFTGTTWHNEGTDTQTRFVNLRDVDTVTTGFKFTRYSTVATDGGNGIWRQRHKNMDDFCMKCHDGKGATGIISYAATPGAAPTGTKVPTAAEALNPFSENTALTRASAPSNSLVRARVVNVFSQFSTAYKWPKGDGTMPAGFTNANYAGNASHHAVRGPRYFGNNAGWGAAAWSTQILKSKQNIGTVREKAQLHCADCHTSDTNGHGSATKFMLVNGSTKSGYVAGSLATDAIDVLCWSCHSGNVYSPSVASPTVGRWDHSQEGGRWDDGAKPTNLGSGCRLCHAGGNGGDPDGVTTSRYGGIHGVTGTTLAGAATRFRFMGGVLMNAVPTSGDAGYNTVSTTTCYGNVTTGWDQCASHNGANKSSYTSRAARPTTY